MGAACGAQVVISALAAQLVGDEQAIKLFDGFDAVAVEAICAGGDLDECDVLDLISDSSTSRW